MHILSIFPWNPASNRGMKPRSISSALHKDKGFEVFFALNIFKFFRNILGTKRCTEIKTTESSQRRIVFLSQLDQIYLACIMHQRTHPSRIFTPLSLSDERF
jgi:hypothetical protein